jgi:hypothetical protein
MISTVTTWLRAALATYSEAAGRELETLQVLIRAILFFAIGVTMLFGLFVCRK